MKQYIPLFAIILLSGIQIGSCTAQMQDTSITVHEWGTFTAKYTGFGIPYTDVNKNQEEPLPPFVHSIDFSKPLHGYPIDEKDYGHELDGIEMLLMNVRIKMETPVLYFYSPFAFNNLDVHVKFNQGSISQFYPMPFHKEDTNYIKGYVNYWVSDVSANNKHYARPGLKFDEYKGFASWRVNILAPHTVQEPTHPDDSVPHIWLMPRKTSANMIECNGAKENYIFYRGLGGFENPVIPFYTEKGNLILKNKLFNEIPFVMVYEKDSAGRIFIWEISQLKSWEEHQATRNGKAVNQMDWHAKYRKKFIDALTREGLFRDEAEAMLNTWDSSYFGKPGLRIFWIVPRSFTDKILPISFSAKVDQLQRVMVGRTEIDPFIEKNALSYRRDLLIAPKERLYSVFPNPVSDALFVNYNALVQEDIELRLLDPQGREIKALKFLMEPFVDNQVPIDLREIPGGIYFMIIKDSLGEKTFKISIQ